MSERPAGRIRRRTEALVVWLANRGPAATGFLALLGAVLAFAILYIDYPFPNCMPPGMPKKCPRPDDVKAFTESGPYFLWLVFLCGQMALWFALLPTLARAVGAFAPHWRENRRQVVGVTVAFALLVVLPVVVGDQIHSNPVYPLPHRQAKISVITAVGAAVALIGAVGIALIYGAIGDALEPRRGLPATTIKRYLKLREALVQLLAVEGAILGAAILATGALRHAVVAIKGEPGFPKETLLAYGIYLSAVVALLYGPTYMRLLELGRDLRDRLIPLADDVAPTVDQLNQRQKLDDLLDLQVGAGTAFRSGVLILAPLTTSLIGLLIGKT